MEKKFIVLSRYEVNVKNGKEFTNWFITETKPLSELEANNKIKEYKENFGFIDQKTKLKHEYTLKDYNEYIKEQEELKNKVKELTIKNEEYLKSSEYKELQKKKRQSAKERKEQQKKYLEEHTK